MSTKAKRLGFVSMLRVGFIVIVLLSMSGLLAQAGTDLDRGTLVELPAVGTINFMAWYNTATPPNEVLTEDSYNSSFGPDQGYYFRSSTAQPTWRFIVGEGGFSTTPAGGATITMLFGGIGAETDKIWNYSFQWDNSGDPAITDHNVGAHVLGAACPTMLSGSRTADAMTITWSGNGASKYAIYRSMNPGKTGATWSNGRYGNPVVVDGSTTSYVDQACGTNDTTIGCWHIVVPLDANNGISGCHSEESTPTAVALRTFRSADPTVNWPLIVGLGALVALTAGGVLYYRKRATTH